MASQRMHSCPVSFQQPKCQASAQKVVLEACLLDHVTQELSVRCTWNVVLHPQWLVFEAEGQLLTDNGWVSRHISVPYLSALLVPVFSIDTPSTVFCT